MSNPSAVKAFPTVKVGENGYYVEPFPIDIFPAICKGDRPTLWAWHCWLYECRKAHLLNIMAERGESQ